MAAILQPTAAEARANRNYEALLWALSRPGEIRTLASSGVDAIIEALCDQEVSLFSNDETLPIRLNALGLRFAELERADYVAIAGQLDAESAALLRSAKCGSRLYPETAATVILEADLGHGPEFALSGPGINGRRTVRISGITPDFWSVRQAACAFPLGWDTFLVDGASVMGLPRSTAIEVL